MLRMSTADKRFYMISPAYKQCFTRPLINHEKYYVYNWRIVNKKNTEILVKVQLGHKS